MSKKTIIIILLALVAVAGVHYGSKAWEKYQHHKKWSRILDKRFIDFEVETPDSTIHHLSDYAGKGEHVMLDFWASWCGSVHRHHPHPPAHSRHALPDAGCRKGTGGL